ncbi:subtilase family protein [Arcicella aurantiaca]|uniref:Subtilase family protein n=1 Tax=Arcicella aurantiaca TaxID=591202 RepID=A0A316EFY0_9BACT|nr:S8/S53 family peptidase [Arcicella aurantiaca]PWK28657.1 subtilase family protein [Arcicella aurantiaca]
MRKFTFFAFMVISLCACTVENSSNESLSPNPASPISKTELDQTIFKSLQDQGKFEWSSVSDVMVWSALNQSDKVLSVGYKPENEGNIDHKIHEINIQETAWKTAREKVLDIIFEEESKTNSSLKRSELEVFEENILPVIDVRVSNLSTIERLRASKLVRYAEPMGYSPNVETNKNNANAKINSDSGCDSNTPETGLTSADYTTISPNAKASWNYAYHSVTQAWAKSTGAGAKMVIIDTGCSNTQENLGSTFNQGSSSGRTIEKLVTLPRDTFLGIPIGSVETPNDGCGHGTSMQGAATAPRGTDGNTAGIAYNANLISIRAAADVFLNESREAKGVADAFTLAGNRTDVRVISMSMGNIISNSQIGDGVRYAYGKGKLIFCAAGTSFGWTAGWAGVIFPASMAEAVAVTGIKDNLTQRCDACHEGSDVDFVVVMEKVANARKPLSLAMSGDTPSTVGGSSVATASTAAMATLVFSKYPTWTRTQVFDRLKQNASYYPSRNGNFGWGRININNALN